MASLFCCYFCLEEASCQSEVSDKVEKLVSRTFVREAEGEIAEVAVLTNFKGRDIEEL